VSRFRLSAEARQDLEDIRTYLIGAGGPQLARYVLGEIRQAIGFVADNPYAGHLRQDLTDEPVRFWSIFSYMVIYDPASKPVGVARILHASLDLEMMFRHRPPI